MTETNENTKPGTSRVALERETLASIKPSIVDFDQWDPELKLMIHKEFMILPIPYEAIKDASKLIAKVVQTVLRTGTQLENLGKELSNIAGTTRSAADGETSGDTVSAVARLIDGAMGPELIMDLGDDAESVIQFLIESGTDAKFDELSKDWVTLPLQLAVKVLRKNLGPELVSFFVGELTEVVSSIKTLTATSSRKGSSSESDTADKKSDPGPSESSSADQTQQST